MLDEAALSACMAYVDLNPIRAGIATTPETSDYTGIQQRIQSAIKREQPKQLLPFVGNTRKDMPKGLPFEVTDYIELVELTGRCIREDKAGYINNNQAPILNRLNISPENWLILTKHFRKCFHGAVGHTEHLTEYCQHLELKKRPTLSICQKLLA